MIRTCAALLLPAVLLLSPAPAEALWRQPYPIPNYAPVGGDILPGTYANVSGGGTCEVYAHRRGYLFINEKGSQALFVYTAPGQLRMTAGTWDPNTTVTVSQDRRGRTVLRFDEPFTPAGYWVSE
jgi:hypothetical protein